MEHARLLEAALESQAARGDRAGRGWACGYGNDRARTRTAKCCCGPRIRGWPLPWRPRSCGYARLRGGGVDASAIVDPSAEVHPTASVDELVVVGPGARIGARSHWDRDA